jgi:hypothetical protein
MNTYQSSWSTKTALIYFLICLAVVGVVMFIRGDSWPHFLLIFPALLLLFFAFYLLDRHKVKRLNELFLRGRLVKNQAYVREEFVDFKDPQALVALLRGKDDRQQFSVRVTYILASGQVVNLRSEHGYTSEFLDEHPQVDFLIDEEDYNNYLVEFGLQQDRVEDEAVTASAKVKNKTN